MKQFDLIIIGGGAVGCAIAYVLSRYDLRIALLERNPDVAMGTSGKNSAVAHAGFNNQPGSLMAKLCVAGNKQFENLCKTLDVPYKKTGKLVIGFNDEDIKIIDQIISDGKRNGSIGLTYVNRAQMEALEPGIAGIGAMFSANTGVFDPFLYTIHLCEAAIQNGVSFFMNNEAQAIRKEGSGFIVTTNEEEYQCGMLVNSAGLYADKVAAMAGDSSFTVYPCRGEYFILDTSAARLISRPVYPVPRKGVGGLGVHLTTTVDGNVLIGPSAEYIDSREDYATTQSMMDNLFREAKTLLPALQRNMVIGTYTGIRSKLVPKGQANYGDFVIEESNKVENLINLVGIESPGLTASMPIAEMVTEIIGAKKALQKRANHKAEYHGRPVFASLDREEQSALIRENPDYGEVICRCKTITKAEVLQALRNPLGVHTIGAVKNRVHTTRGRCQGGYCFTKIADIIREELNVSPEDIAYRYPGDRPFSGTVK
ncbi:FAD/NAD(P)-binding oxidoreductase [Spirochaetia bacterium]|nr:FAD/NAD(P)-binding oxidoreductase [Spirochaetia bacterium]